MHVYSVTLMILPCFLKIKYIGLGRSRLGPVHTYPDIFESATFSFRTRLSSTRIRRIGMRIRNVLNPLSRVEIFEYANNLEPRGRCEK